MKKTIRIQKTESALWLDSDLTFAQVPDWFGHVTKDLKMSILRHQEDAPRPRPLIIWICGGGWVSLNKDAHLPEFVQLAKQGYVIASIEYRTSNSAKFPAQLEDVKAGIRYLRAHAERFQIDSGSIGIMGESAGGHLAALAGLTTGMKEFDKGAYLEERSDVQAVCDWYGVTDMSVIGEEEGFESHKLPESVVSQLLGNRISEHHDLAQAANPLSYITEDAPPFLILHGDQDKVVPQSQSELLYNALRERGNEAQLHIIEGAGHATLEFYQPEVKRIISNFFDENLNKTAKG